MPKLPAKGSGDASAQSGHASETTRTPGDKGVA